MTLGVPFGIIFCFLPFINNMNIFFPSFGIILGIIFGIASYVYKLKNYAFLSLTLIIGCFYIALQIEQFAIGGYYVAGCLAVFSFLNRIIGEVKFNFAKKAANASSLNKSVTV
jgi:asparagine N-glycosylation enzyme membrane subunit Stt3